MEPSSTEEDVLQSNMKQRLRCKVLWENNHRPVAIDNQQDLHRKVLQVMANSSRLEQKLDRCLWAQEVFIVLVMGMMALWGFTLYMYFSAAYSRWTMADN